MNGCNRCPAFAKCPDFIYRGSACAALRSTYGLENDPETVSNADIIRNMNDVELTDFLNQWGTATRAWQKDPGETLHWLQKPVDEKTGENESCQ